MARRFVRQKAAGAEAASDPVAGKGTWTESDHVSRRPESTPPPGRAHFSSRKSPPPEGGAGLGGWKASNESREASRSAVASASATPLRRADRLPYDPHRQCPALVSTRSVLSRSTLRQSGVADARVAPGISATALQDAAAHHHALKHLATSRPPPNAPAAGRPWRR